MKDITSINGIDIWSDDNIITLTDIMKFDYSIDQTNGICSIGAEGRIQSSLVDDDLYQQGNRAKLRNIHSCLKTMLFMLEQYSKPDGEAPVVPFKTTQDMAKYFKLMCDVCLKASDIEG